MMGEKNNLVNIKQTAENSKKYPEPIVGVLIYNDKGEIFLIKSSKWGDLWQIPGGHVELGETEVEALKREVMEETGLKIDNIKLEGVQECIYPKQFEKKVHFIFHDYSARLTGGEIVEKNREMSEYIWIKPEQALRELKLNPYTKITVERFIKNRNVSYEDRYKRALADYQNLLKQTAKEKMEFARFANEQLLYQLLPVYDHLKIALENQNEENHNSWLEGVRHVVKQFKNVLKETGVEEIKTIGEKFDHNFMEAISEEATTDEKQDGIVAKEVRAGYKLNGKVIIPAKVVVYKKKS